jgi:serine/threonine protein kinase
MSEHSNYFYDIGQTEHEIRQKKRDARDRKNFRIALCSDGFDSLDAFSETDQDPEYVERVKSFMRSVFMFIDSAHKVHGRGSNNRFYVVENPGESVSHCAAEELGVRRISRIRRRHRSGEYYYGIPSTIDQPRPLDDFVHGIEVQMLAHEKGVNVPYVSSVILHEGAISVGRNPSPSHDEKEGNIIVGTEETAVDIIAVMETIPGITFEQLCDPDLSLRNGVKHHKDGYQIMNFFKNGRTGIRENIIGAIESGGCRYVLDWDFDAISRRIQEQVSLLHTANEEFPAILHNDLHAGNIIITPDSEVFLIDFDLAKVVDAEDGEAGTSLVDYKDMGKSVEDKNVYYLPDSYIRNKGDDVAYAPMSAVEQIQMYIDFVKETVDEYRISRNTGE